MTTRSATVASVCGCNGEYPVVGPDSSDGGLIANEARRSNSLSSDSTFGPSPKSVMTAGATAQYGLSIVAPASSPTSGEQRLRSLEKELAIAKAMGVTPQIDLDSAEFALETARKALGK